VVSLKKITFAVLRSRIMDRQRRYCINGSAVPSNAFGHHNHIDICLSIFGKFSTYF